MFNFNSTDPFSVNSIPLKSHKPREKTTDLRYKQNFVSDLEISSRKFVSTMLFFLLIKYVNKLKSLTKWFSDSELNTHESKRKLCLF